MTQRLALVTGTRKGLGLAIAEHLLQQGWLVAGCSRKPAPLQHPHYTHHELDLGDEKAVIALVRAVARQAKSSGATFEALINNAGSASMNHLLLTPVASLQRLFELNVFGSFACLREAAKVMQRNKTAGRIINFTSVAVPLNLEGEAAYAASKAALESLTRVAARELGPYGITVNALGPTPVPTDLIKGVPKEKIDDLVNRQSIRRLGTTADVCNVVDFFLDRQSDFITGQTLYLGGIN